MREQGRFCLLIHSLPTPILTWDAKALRDMCNWAQTEHVYFVESGICHVVEEAIKLEEPNVEFISFTFYMSTMTAYRYKSERRYLLK